MRRLIMNTIPWSFYDLNSYMERGIVTYDHSSQRGLKWDKKRKSKLIDSILNGVFIGTFICNKVGEHFDVLDGKQRGNTVPEFMADGFEINIPATTSLNDDSVIDLRGCKFSDLPEELQQRIQNYNLAIYFYEGLTEEEAAEIIARANNGKSMTGVEKARIGSASLNTYKEMGKHEMFNLLLTPTAINGSGDAEIIAKTWIMLYADKKCFDKEVFNPVMQTTVITDSEKYEILRIYDYVVKVYKYLTEDGDKSSIGFAKNVFKKTHLLSLIPFFKDASIRNTPVEDFSSWLKIFYDIEDKKNASIDKKYNANCKGGTGHEAAIRARNKALRSSYEELFSEET